MLREARWLAALLFVALIYILCVNLIIEVYKSWRGSTEAPTNRETLLFKFCKLTFKSDHIKEKFLSWFAAAPFEQTFVSYQVWILSGNLTRFNHRQWVACFQIELDKLRQLCEFHQTKTKGFTREGLPGQCPRGTVGAIILWPLPCTTVRLPMIELLILLKTSRNNFPKPKVFSISFVWR